MKRHASINIFEVERQLQNQKDLIRLIVKAVELSTVFLKSTKYYIYIIKMKKAEQILGPDPDNTSQFIGISDDIIQLVKVEGKVTEWELGEWRTSLYYRFSAAFCEYRWGR